MPDRPESAPLAVHTVTVGARLDGTYVFADHDDAQAFVEALKEQGRDVVYDEQIIISREQAKVIIDDEAAEA